MATTINPAVSGVSYKRWVGHVGLYAGAVAAGAWVTWCATRVLYLGLVAVGGKGAWFAISCAVVGLAALRDAGYNAPVPYPARTQVPEWLRRMLPPGGTAAAYGFQLGLGFSTRFTYSTHTAFVAFLATIGNAQHVIVAVAVFAVGKSIVVLASLGGKSYPAFERRILWRHRRSHRARRSLAVSNALLTVCTVALFVNQL